MKHLLVTNDFPPKVGGIQSYLWELWRRLPPEKTTVLTTPYVGADAFDEAQEFRVVRSRQKVLLPTRELRGQILALADEVGAELILLDPALPLGQLGPSLGRPYGVVLHGAEITAPGHTPGFRQLLARVLVGADVVIAAGGYPADEGERAAGRGLPVTVVPPGVDVERFRPLSPQEKVSARERLGLPVDQTLVVSVSRLVPRKGMDTLIRASALLAGDRPPFTVAIGGTGRDRDRLAKLVAKTNAPVRLLGRVPDDDLPDLYGSADVFAMLCRNRWAGLEQEGFGIVFLEAAACGVPQLAGDSGGAAEAVADGRTGLVARHPSDATEVAALLGQLLDDRERRTAMGDAARVRAQEEFAYDVLAGRLHDALEKARR